MSPNTEMATTSPANPQMPSYEHLPPPLILNESSRSSGKHSAGCGDSTPSSSEGKICKDKYARTPSWIELSHEPRFNIGVLIDNTSINDRHVAAISKPASSCSLTAMVILHSSSFGSTNSSVVQESADEAKAKLVATAGEWLRTNKAELVMDYIAFGEGQAGWENMLESSDIDAVYIVVPPWYVLFLCRPLSSGSGRSSASENKVEKNENPYDMKTF